MMMRAFLFAFLIFLCVISCEYEAPDPIWNPGGEGYLPDPVIDSVSPPEWAFAGITPIDIYGYNFTDSLDENIVYFDNKPGDILFYSDSLITVKPPYEEELIKDSVVIKVVVAKALLPAIHYYELKKAVSEYGNVDLSSDRAFSIAVDADENLYVQLKSKKVVKILHTGEQIDDWGSVTFPKASQMRIGPGGDLYIQKSNNKVMYRIPAAGGDCEEFIEFSKRMMTFDFGESGEMYVAGRETGIFVVDINSGTYVDKGIMGDWEINVIRVYGGYVYVLGVYKGSDSSIPPRGVWRVQIKDGGEIGDPELVVDWRDVEGYGDANFKDMTFDCDGYLYVATDGADPIVVFDSMGGYKPLYEGIINPTAEKIVWGNDVYMYMLQTGTERKLYRINMAKEGAPYYGRGL